MHRAALARSLVLLWAATLPTTSAVLAAQPEFVPDQIIVKYRAGVQASNKATLLDRLGGSEFIELRIIHGAVLKLKGMNVETAIDLAKQDPNIEYAEPDWVVHAFVTPNDSLFGSLYAMQNTGQTGGVPGADIQATRAWDIFTGDPNVMVGVIDTGVDYTHPDLAANIWTNPGEIPGNQIDDDGNGYVDDVHGYDFFNHDGDPMDDQGHGTHVSGTIGAVGNNGRGVVGVNWRCKIVAMKFLNSAGAGTTDGAVQALQYALTVGVQLTSNSWGGGGFSQALLDAINAAGAANQLFVNAAGNNGKDNDLLVDYPSGYNSPYIVAVAATDDHDQLASFSNYGETSVDLGAPGVHILSTVPRGACQLCDASGYKSLSGTSMATPHVAGVCALLYGRFPGILNAVVKDLVQAEADPIPALAGRCVTGARLNAYVPLLSAADSIPPAPIPDLATSNPGSTTLSLHWTATGDDGDIGLCRRYEIRRSTQPLDASNFATATLCASVPTLPPGSPQSADLAGLDYSTTYYFAIKAIDEFGNSALSNVATGTTLGPPAIATSTLPQDRQLFKDGQVTEQLTIGNTGAGTLDFTIPQPQLVLPTVSQAAATKTAVRVPVEPGVEAYGGPDSFGYRWEDSDQPGGPTFAWVDISHVGTRIDWGDNNGGLDPTRRGPFTMGFEFPWYGTTVHYVWAYSDGYLRFTSGNVANPNDPTPLPSGAAPTDMVAPFWFDGDPRTPDYGAAGYYCKDVDRFICTWVNVSRWPFNLNLQRYTFQVIVYRSGEIRFQYLSLDPLAEESTAGIQDGTRTIGVTVACRQPYLHNGLAVRLLPMRQWLRTSPTSGRILAGEQAHVTVTYDATGYAAGTYDGIVRLLTNAPVPQVQVATSMQVSGLYAPHLTASGTSIGARLLENSSESKTLRITNAGRAPGENLSFSILPTVAGPGIAAAPPGGPAARIGVEPRPQTLDWLEVSPTNGSVASRFFTDVAVRFNSAGLTPGDYQGNLHLETNDPDVAAVDIPVSLQVVTPTDVVSEMPRSLALTLSGSNPVRGDAHVVMAIPGRDAVDVRVYNAEGAVVRRLVHEVRQPGFHDLSWDGKDEHGHSVASGVYFLCLRSRAHDKTLRVVMIR